MTALLAPIVLMSVLLAGCGGCGTDEDPGSFDAGPPLRCERPDAGPYDSGLPPLDAPPTSGGWLPEVTHLPHSVCDDWPPVRPMRPPPPDTQWEVLWSWQLPPWGDRIWSGRTDFEVPRIIRDGANLAVTSDRIYVPMGDTGGVAALSYDGGLLWGRNLPGRWGPNTEDDGLDDDRLTSPPVATPDGDVLVASSHGRLLYYDRNGQERWRFEPGVPIVVGFTGPGATIALGPGGRIYWSVAGQPTMYALNRCGEPVWRADAPEDQGFGSLMVDVDGALFTTAYYDAVFRFEPDGTVHRLYDNPRSWDGQYLSPVGLHLDGTIHMSEGNPRENPREDPWSYATAISGRDARIVSEVRYQAAPRETDASAVRWMGILEPFGFVTTRVVAEPEPALVGTWYWPGVEREFTMPIGLVSLRVLPDGGFIQVGCDRALLIPAGSSAAHGITGLVEIGYPGTVFPHLPDAGGLHEKGVLAPSGMLAIQHGGGGVILIRTPLTPGPGWSQHRANAWNSGSLAVHP